MNYQQFLEMNLLVSDQLLSEFHLVLPYFVLLIVSAFYLLMFLHITLFRLYQVLRQPPRQFDYSVSQDGL